MPIDYRSFSLNGPPAMQDGVDRRWWTLAPDEAAKSITASINNMRDNQSARATQWTISSRLYGNLSPSTIAGVSFSRLAATMPAMRDRITFNGVQSVIDTVTAKIAKNRPKPLFLTSGGDYRQQRQAKMLNAFADGVFYENHTHDLGVQVFRDACVWGDGFIHVFERDGRVAHERVLPSEIYVDEMEALYGEPRQMHRIKAVDRAVLLDLFPDKRDVIMEASAARLDDTGRSVVADLVQVRESWHLPSGPEAKDGAHVLTLDGYALTEMEPWAHQWFPFARMSWSPRLYGFWSQGLAEQLQNLQLEVNKLLWVIQRSFHLGGSFKILIENGSKIVKEHLNNEIGAIVNYSGTPPAYVTPPMVPGELFGHLQNLISKMYEQAGISQLSAGSMKPAGLNSGKALREFNDIESDRFHVVGRAYERLFLDVARLSIATVQDIAGGRRSYEVRVPGRKAITKVDWKGIDLRDSDYVMQCYPVSSLPNDPAGRLQTVQEYAQAGFLSPRQARRLLDFPDLDAVEALGNAAEDYLVSILDKMVDEGVYAPPEPYDDLALGRQMALEYYAHGKSNDLEEERLELLRRFLAQINALEIAAMPPPPPEAVEPPAPPVPLQPSDLVANAPGLQ